MHDRGQLHVCVDQFRAERHAIRAAVEAHGYNQKVDSYTRTFDGEDLDASLLVLPMHDSISARLPRMRSTFDRVHGALAHGSPMRRYRCTSTDDGSPPGEGAFGICRFWAVDCLARRGDLPGAKRAFESLLGYANLGL